MGICGLICLECQPAFFSALLRPTGADTSPHFHTGGLRLREMKCPAQVPTAGTCRVDIPQADVPNSKTHACPTNPGIRAGLSGNISLRTGVGTSLSKTVKRCCLRGGERAGETPSNKCLQSPCCVAGTAGTCTSLWALVPHSLVTAMPHLPGLCTRCSACRKHLSLLSLLGRVLFRNTASLGSLP